MFRSLLYERSWRWYLGVVIRYGFLEFIRRHGVYVWNYGHEWLLRLYVWKHWQ
jgi:hypothetical protein